MSNHRNQVLRLGTATKLEILNAYSHNKHFGHDCARRYIYEVAEAVTLQEDRAAAASMLYQIADLCVGKLPLPDSLFPPKGKSSAEKKPAPVGWRRLLVWFPTQWFLGFCIGYMLGHGP